MLDGIADRFQHAALDPSAWSDILHDLSMAVGGVGAVLLSTDRLLPGTPVSQNIKDLHDDYFRLGWNAADLRYRGARIAVTRGVTVDQDFTDPEEMRRSPYYRDWLERHGCRFFAAVGTSYEDSAWFVSIQRSIDQSLFEPEERRRLATLSKPLNDAVALSTQFSHKRVIGMADALQLARQAALLLNENGKVLAMNTLAEDALRTTIGVGRGQLQFSDRRSQDSYDKLVARALSREVAEGPVSGLTVVRSGLGTIVPIRAVALRGWARYTFTNASVMILVGAAESEPRNPEEIMKATFGLTRAEARLAQALRSGRSVAEAADGFGIAYETARSQLRSVFLKTDTNRQGQLIAALAHLPEGVE